MSNPAGRAQLGLGRIAKLLYPIMQLWSLCIGIIHNNVSRYICTAIISYVMYMPMTLPRVRSRAAGHEERGFAPMHRTAHTTRYIESLQNHICSSLMRMRIVHTMSYWQSCMTQSMHILTSVNFLHLCLLNCTLSFASSEGDHVRSKIRGF
jgi:hypothetical protein